MMHGLGLPKYAAAGLLEMLWHYTARFAPTGDVGKWSDAHLAAAMSWEGDSARLIEVLHACGFLDDGIPGCRWYVHDWHEHADENVHRVLARSHLYFANGTTPNTSGLATKERDTANAFYAKKKTRGKVVATPGARRAHVVGETGPPRPPAVAVPSLARAIAIAEPGETDSPDGAPPAVVGSEAKSWSTEAGELWAHFRGTPNYGRIGKALGPWVEANTWDVVRPLWQMALEDAATWNDPTKFTPEHFASNYRAWTARAAAQAAMPPGSTGLVRMGARALPPPTPKDIRRAATMETAITGGLKGDGTYGGDRQ